jgi:hypothetical protein
MPQLQNLVLSDRESTPVAHTFTPRDITGGVGTVVESTGVPIGENTVTVSLRKTPSGRYKAVIKGRFPIVQTQDVNGIESPVVVRTAYAELTFDFDQTSTEQERKNVVGMMEDALTSDEPLTNDVLTKLQGVY